MSGADGSYGCSSHVRCAHFCAVTHAWSSAASRRRHEAWCRRRRCPRRRRRAGRPARPARPRDPAARCAKRRRSRKQLSQNGCPTHVQTVGGDVVRGDAPLGHHPGEVDGRDEPAGELHQRPRDATAELEAGRADLDDDLLAAGHQDDVTTRGGLDQLVAQRSSSARSSALSRSALTSSSTAATPGSSSSLSTCWVVGSTCDPRRRARARYGEPHGRSRTAAAVSAADAGADGHEARADPADGPPPGGLGSDEGENEDLEVALVQGVDDDNGSVACRQQQPGHALDATRAEIGQRHAQHPQGRHLRAGLLLDPVGQRRAAVAEGLVCRVRGLADRHVLGALSGVVHVVDRDAPCIEVRGRQDDGVIGLPRSVAPCRSTSVSRGKCPRSVESLRLSSATFVPNSSATRWILSPARAEGLPSCRRPDCGCRQDEERSRRMGERPAQVTVVPPRQDGDVVDDLAARGVVVENDHVPARDRVDAVDPLSGTHEVQRRRLGFDQAVQGRRRGRRPGALLRFR